MRCNWGDVSLANVYLSNSMVSWSSSMWLHAHGNAVTCTVTVSQHSFASTPTLFHGIWTDTGPMHWFHSFERLKIAKWKSGIRSCSSVSKGFARNNAQMISKLPHPFNFNFYICTGNGHSTIWLVLFSTTACQFIGAYLLHPTRGNNFKISTSISW